MHQCMRYFLPTLHNAVIMLAIMSLIEILIAAIIFMMVMLGAQYASLQALHVTNDACRQTQEWLQFN